VRCVAVIAGPTRERLTALGRWTALWGDFCTAQFSTLMTFHDAARSATGQRQLAFYRAVSLSETVIYVLGTVVPATAMLYVDKSLGPTASKQAALLVARNCGVILWAVSIFVGTRLSVQQVQRTGVSSGAEGKVTKVLGFLKSEQNKVSKTACVTIVVYVVFTTPLFWGWQQYSVGALGIVSAFSSSPALVLWRSRKTSNQVLTSTVTMLAHSDFKVPSANKSTVTSAAE